MDLPPTQPQPFPNPVIGVAVYRANANVFVSVGQLERKAVIASGSGRLYEVGVTLKKAIFGEVIHAHLLLPSEGNSATNTAETDTFVRTDQHRAIKIYSKRKLREMQGRTAENPLMEITALQFIGDDHPNIMGQIECCADSLNIYSVMRFCPGGELYEYIETHGSLDVDQARSMFRQLMNGLSHLQRLGIGHRDLSLENMLFDGNELYEIIDFGMCLRMKFDAPSGRYAALLKQSSCGKRNYIAPEVLREDAVFDPMLCDIWAAGVILFISLTGVPPVDTAMTSDQRYLMVCAGRLQEMLTSWGMDVDPLAVDLVQRIMRPNPADRLTIPQIIAHPWMQHYG